MIYALEGLRTRFLSLFYKGREVGGVGSSNTDLHGFGVQVRKELFRRLPKGKAIKVLDVGTGFAITAEFLARTLSKGSRVWTLDPSAEVLRRARKSLKAKGLDSRIEFVRGSVDRLDMPEGFFDALVSVMALHHMEDLRSALGEMARVTRDHGRILLVDYSPEAARKLEFRVRHRKQDFFPARKVAAILEKGGFPATVSDFGLWYLVEGRK